MVVFLRGIALALVVFPLSTRCLLTQRLKGTSVSDTQLFQGTANGWLRLGRCLPQ